MAKFEVISGADFTMFEGAKESGDVLTTDDILECLRPAAMRLVERYRETIRRLFKRRTGSFEDSIDFEDDVTGPYAFILVKPFGRHKGSSYTRKSRAGPADRKGAKHNRKPSKRELKNEELGYLLEVGTPRIAATHWMENTNESVGDEIQDIIEDEYTKLLKKKGLID
jgi:hypothetical protein